MDFTGFSKIRIISHVTEVKKDYVAIKTYN